MRSWPQRNPARLVSGALFAVFVIFALFGYRRFECEASATVQASDKLKDPRFIGEGASLFARSCANAYCHGTEGGGGGAPRLRGKGLEAGYVFRSVSNGIPNTSMVGFKTDLSQEQIWKLVAYIVSDSKAGAHFDPIVEPPRSTPIVKPPEASTSQTGNAQAGKALFFGSSEKKSCHACHSFDGAGTPIGPDLSAAGSRSARQLFLSIILPREMKDRYATITVTLRSGETIVGVKKEEDAESIRIYDATELPAVLRTVQKTEIVKVDAAGESIMPNDYASIYTMKQLLDLVSFLKSSESKSAIKLTDLIQ